MRPRSRPRSTYVITAKDRAFWSFQPIGKPAVAARAQFRLDQDTDRCIHFGNLGGEAFDAGAAPTDRRTLLRRVTFDLIGLPPTPAEIANFLNDDAPDAYARVVERLLASPQYGERWARHWLDVARYGEDQAHTFQARLYPDGFRYRDWVVDAFNRDLPYDQFIQEQIAADLLPGADPIERLPALGFFALGPVYYGDAKKLDQYDDRIDTLTRGFMGLTVACARCHDHKFDPIPTRDYYALASVFASSDYVETPLIPEAEIEKLRAALTEAEKKKKVTPKYPLIHALKEAAKPTTLRVCIRGNPDNLGEEAPRHFLTILGDAAPRAFHEGQRPARAGPGHCQCGQPADGAGVRQSSLGAPFRQGPRAHAQQLWPFGRAAEPSRAARRSGPPVHRGRLVDQELTTIDRTFGRLSAEHAIRCPRI